MQRLTRTCSKRVSTFDTVSVCCISLAQSLTICISYAFYICRVSFRGAGAAATSPWNYLPLMEIVLLKFILMLISA